MAKDKDYIRMIHSSRWTELRRQVLTEHPLCEMCERDGYVAAAREVHHRTPVETAVTRADKERLMFNRGNLMALCHDCHVRIHTEMGRSGRKLTRERNAARTAADIARIFGD